MSAIRKEYEAKLRAEAVRVRGIRFLMNGRVPSQGFDCLGLIVHLQRAAGVADFPDADRPFAIDWHLHEQNELYLEGLRTYGQEIELAKIKVGDVLMFRLGVILNAGSMRIQHAGVVIEPAEQRFVHCITGRGVTTSTLKERAWSMCLSAVGRPLAVMRYLGESA